MVRKLFVLLLIATAGACRASAPTVGPTGALYGASSPRGAVESFLGGVRGQDLQAVSAVWGTERGPLMTAGDITRDELERRVLIMMCYFRHDEARVLEQAAAVRAERPAYRVELRRGDRTRTTTFTTAQGPQQRWYVADADVVAVRDFCEQPNRPSGD